MDTGAAPCAERRPLMARQKAAVEEAGAGPEEEEKIVEEPIEELEELKKPEEETEEKPRKHSRKSKKASKPEKKAKAPVEGIGAREVAQAAGVKPAELRRFLRAHKELVEGHEHGKGYNWPSLKDPAVKAIIKAVKSQGNGKEAKS
jgi:phage antirepressor YoqD-like protein